MAHSLKKEKVPAARAGMGANERYDDIIRTEGAPVNLETFDSRNIERMD